MSSEEIKDEGSLHWWNEKMESPKKPLESLWTIKSFVSRCSLVGCESLADFSSPGLMFDPIYSFPFSPDFNCDVKESNISEKNVNTVCLVDLCNRSPSYGHSDFPTHCKFHRQPGMSHINTICEAIGCLRMPSFAPLGEQRRRFCKEHSNETMVNLQLHRCDTAGCDLKAVFMAKGSDGRISQRACQAHRDDSMTMKSSTCQNGQCAKQANYGFPGQRPSFCAFHRIKGTEQTRTRKCMHDGCNRIPSYGSEPHKRQYCKQHALNGMTYNAGFRCRSQGCSSTGSFNYRGNKLFVYCKAHKQPGMVDVMSKRCEQESCDLIATFGLLEERKKRFCSKHKSSVHVSCKEWTPSAKNSVGKPHKRKKDGLWSSSNGSAFTPIGQKFSPTCLGNSKGASQDADCEPSNNDQGLPMNDWVVPGEYSDQSDINLQII